MQEAIDQFRANLARVRNFGSIVEELLAQTTSVDDLTDVLRAELVLAVSALDHYIHEVVRIGMLESYRGSRPRTSQFRRFQVSLGSALDAVSVADALNDNWINEEIRSRHGFRSFQTPDHIAAAIRLISGVILWSEVAVRMRTSPEEIRETLIGIVDRRNKIAHEADMSPLLSQGRTPIDREMVTEAVDFLERVAETIHTVIR